MPNTIVTIERAGNGYLIKNNRFAMHDTKVALNLASAIGYVIEAIAEVRVGEREKIADRIGATLIDNNVRELP